MQTAPVDGNGSAREVAAIWHENLEEVAQFAGDTLSPGELREITSFGERFRGRDFECAPCPLKTRCLRNPAQGKGRQITFFTGKDPSFESATDRMRRRIDSPEGRRRYGRRFATVEPVFANLRHNKQLNRFTLRGRQKVDTQWKLYCMVHNIEKLAHFGKLGEGKIEKR